MKIEGMMIAYLAFGVSLMRRETFKYAAILDIVKGFFLGIFLWPIMVCYLKGYIK